MSETLEFLVGCAIDDLNDWLAEFDPDEATSLEPHDTIFEVCDSSVPVYTYNLMKLGADNLQLATDVPELGPAFDGSPTPVNIIATNIFEHVQAALWERFRNWQEEMEELELESV